MPHKAQVVQASDTTEDECGTYVCSDKTSLVMMPIPEYATAEVTKLASLAPLLLLE